MKLLVFIVFLLVSIGASAQEPKSIHVATDAWEGYSNPDGTGLYFDILRLIYEPLGITVNYTVTPYKRSVLMVTSKKLDAWVASYENEIEDAIYPKTILGYDQVVALYKKSTFPTWEGEASLEHKNLAWVRGYGYEDYLSVHTRWRELNHRDDALPLLELDRVDALLDHIEDIDALVRSADIDTKHYQTGPVFHLDLYVGFANTTEGKAFANIWDSRMAEIISSGELKQLWEKWQKSPYPFTATPSTKEK